MTVYNDIIKKKQIISSIYFTILCERWSFYSFCSILILILIKNLGYTEQNVYMIFGTFNALLFLYSIFGGILIDKYIGPKQTLILSIFLLFIGYLLLVIPHISILIAMSFIILGGGLFKTAPTTIIAKTYNNDANNMKTIFTILYMILNISVVLSTIIISILYKKYDYHITLIGCGIGIIIALLGLILKHKLFNNIDNNKYKITLKQYLCLFIIILTSLIVNCVLLTATKITFYLIIIIVPIILIYFIVHSLNIKELIVKYKQIIGIYLILHAIIFNIIYNQMFSTVVLFAQHNSNSLLLGLPVSPMSYQALGGIATIIFCSIITQFYLLCKRKNYYLNIPVQFSIGLILSGISLFLLVPICYYSETGIINGNWFILIYFIYILAEILINTLSLSMIAQYMSPKILGLAMGGLQASYALSCMISGKLSSFAAISKEMNNPLESITIYINYFWHIGSIIIILGIVSYITTKIITKIFNKSFDTKLP